MRGTLRHQLSTALMPALVVLMALAVNVSASQAKEERSGSEPQAPDRLLEAMTYNIQYGFSGDGTPGTDVRRAAAVIREEDPDVVGLQEVLRGCAFGQYKGVDQMAVLREALPEYRFTYHAPWEANYEQGEGEPRCQIGGAVLSKYPILDASYILLPSESVYQRGMLDALLEVNGVPVRFYNTHLQNQQGGDPAADADRRAQAEAIAEYTGKFEEPTILTGDLNDVPEAEELAPLFTIFDDAWVEGGDDSPGYTHEAADPARRIDYVLASPVVEVKQTRVLNTLASDHLPVVSSFLMPGDTVGRDAPSR